MQQAVETKPSPLERQLKVAVPVAQLEAEIASRIKKLARTVKMQGFRPGKVPIKMVERHYGYQVRQEVLSDSVQRSFAEAVRDQNYRVAGMPRFEPVQGEGDQSAFEFQAVFEVYPDITHGDLAGCKVARPVTKVEEADVDATVETLRKQRAKYENVTRGAATGDLVNIDFEGKIDGAALRGRRRQELHRRAGRGTHAAGVRGGAGRPHGRAAEELPHHLPRGLRRPPQGQDRDVRGHREPGGRAEAARGGRRVRQSRWASRMATWRACARRSARTSSAR